MVGAGVWATLLDIDSCYAIFHGGSWALLRNTKYPSHIFPMIVEIFIRTMFCIGSALEIWRLVAIVIFGISLIVRTVVDDLTLLRTILKRNLSLDVFEIVLLVCQPHPCTMLEILLDA